MSDKSQETRLQIANPNPHVDVFHSLVEIGKGRHMHHIIVKSLTRGAVDAFIQIFLELAALRGHTITMLDFSEFRNDSKAPPYLVKQIPKLLQVADQHTSTPVIIVKKGWAFRLLQMLVDQFNHASDNHPQKLLFTYAEGVQYLNHQEDLRDARLAKQSADPMSK